MQILTDEQVSVDEQRAKEKGKGFKGFKGKGFEYIYKGFKATPGGADSGNCGNDEGGKGKDDGKGQGNNDEGDPLEALEAAGAIDSFTDRLREKALEEWRKNNSKDTEGDLHKWGNR